MVTLAWGLWLGGMVFLFISLGSIFSTPGLDRETAGLVASGLFPKFERYQLVLAAVAILASAGWWTMGRTRVKLVLFALFGLATVAAVIETTSITPKIEAMRVAGLRGTPAFDRMHAISSRVYLSGAGVLLVAGLLLPSAWSTASRDVGRADEAPSRGRVIATPVVATPASPLPRDA